LALARREGDRFVEGFALQGLGEVAVLRGDIEQATHVLQEGLAIHEAIGDPFGIAWLQTALGRTRWLMGDRAEAERLTQESLRVRWSMRDLRTLGDSLGTLAMYVGERGSSVDAARLFGATDTVRRATGAVLLR